MKLSLIQQKIQSALEGLEYFKPIPVIAEDKGDVSNRLQTAIAKTRRCVLLMTPNFDVTSSASKIMVGSSSVVVQAMEKIPENRTLGGPSAQDMAEVAAWNLNMLPLDDVGVLACRSIRSEMIGDTVLSYIVTFEVQTTLSDPLDNRKEEAV